MNFQKQQKFDTNVGYFVNETRVRQYCSTQNQGVKVEKMKKKAETQIVVEEDNFDKKLNYGSIILSN